MRHFYNHMEAVKNHNADQKEHYDQRCTEFANSPIGFNKIVFLRDSLTEGTQNWKKYFNNNRIDNRGIGGDTTERVLARLDEIYYYKPLAVFLLIGINDIINTDSPNREKTTVETVSDNIILIKDTIANQGIEKNFIQTIPINNNIYFKENGWFPNHRISLNKQINRINRSIKKQSKDKLHTIIDLHSAFSDNNGLLNKSFTSDGVHLNQNGYKTWANFIQNDFDAITLNPLTK